MVDKHNEITYSEPNKKVRCKCLADVARFEIAGLGIHEVNFEGFMEIVSADESLKDGYKTLELIITDHQTQGVSQSLGSVTVSHNFDKKAPMSYIQENEVNTGFPATQRMFVNINLKLESMPNLNIENKNIGILTCSDQKSFPPENAVYELENPVDLVDSSNPKNVIGKILSYHAVINPS